MEEKEKIQKIKSIIEKEIEKELGKKQDEVSEISEKIKTVLGNLELLKYVVAVSYYDQNSTLTPKKIQNEENENEKVQTNIHPCIKKLLPFRSNYNKSTGSGPANNLQELQNNKKEIRSEPGSVEIKKEVVEDATTIKCPKYIPPLPNSDENVEIVNSARGNVAKDRYRIIIGNVSKWLSPDTREDNSTHKWMVYIRNNDDSKDITKLIKKVRYFLHESYKPHDIIDVTTPFHLTRRGWGEFPIRVQLHFINSLNKPVDIIHNLKLDMTCSGIQMVGAETVIDVCLHKNGSILPGKNIKLETKCDGMKEEVVNEKQDVFDGNLLTDLVGFNSCSEVAIKKEVENDVVIKTEVKDDFECESLFDPKLEEMKTAICNSRRFLLDRRKALKIIEIEHNYLSLDENKEREPINKYAHSILQVESSKNQNVGEKTCKNGALVDFFQINQFINKRNQDRLNKIEMSSWKSEEEVFKTLKSFVNKLEAETQSKYCLKAIRHMYLVNVLQRAHATKLKTVEHLIRWFVQRWPIITKLATDPTYKNVHPYSCSTEEQFFKYNIGKQRSSEWFRAKAIQKVLKSLKSVIPINEEIWSTKQILLWCRFHGYSPSSFQKAAKNESVEECESNDKRLKFNDSSSDSNDGFEHFNKKLKTSEHKHPNGLFVEQKNKNFKRSRRKDLNNGSYSFIDYKDCNTYSEASDSSRFGSNEFRSLQSTEECEIDVVSIDNEPKESPSKKRKAEMKVVTTPSWQMPLGEFVCETARQIGVKIEEEEVIDGVFCDSVSRVLSQSLTTFLEELVRKSFAHGWMRNKERCPESLEVNDVLTTLIEHPQFDIFTNKGLGQTVPKKSEF